MIQAAPEATVEIAVGFDQLTEPLVACARGLVKRADLATRLVHVSEPWLESSWTNLYTAEAGAPELNDELVEEATTDAAERLRQLARTIPGQVSTSVITGGGLGALVEDAQHHACQLLIIGASRRSYRFVPRGFSNALSILGSASIPVLVLCEGTTLDLSKPRIRILVADDLEAESISAINFAFDLAVTLGDTDVIQAHVCNFGSANLRRALNELIGEHGEKDVDDDRVFDRARGNVERQLHQRAEGQVARLAATGGSHSLVLAEGNVSRELSDIVTRLAPDLIVYGRHRTFHKEFKLGHMPPYAMLAQRHPLVVVPPAS